MQYQIIQPPFTLRFRAAEKSKAQEYLRWFLKAIPERIQELARAVRQSKDYSAWNADFSSDSLQPLGLWFASNVETRRRSDEELETLNQLPIFEFGVPLEELTNKTFSLAVDIGMYFGETLIHQHHSLNWGQLLDDRKFADYGHPLILGFDAVPLNPVRIAVTLAYGLARRNRTGNRLYELYAYWDKCAPQGQ